MWPQPFLGVGPEDPDHDPQIAATAALQRRLGEVFKLTRVPASEPHYVAVLPF